MVQLHALETRLTCVQVRTFSKDELRSLFRVNPTIACETHNAIKCSCDGSVEAMESCSERAAAAAAGSSNSEAEQQGVLAWAHLAKASHSPDPTWQAMTSFVRDNYVTYVFSDHVLDLVPQPTIGAAVATAAPLATTAAEGGGCDARKQQSFKKPAVVATAAPAAAMTAARASRHTLGAGGATRDQKSSKHSGSDESENESSNSSGSESDSDRDDSSGSGSDMSSDGADSDDDAGRGLNAAAGKQLPVRTSNKGPETALRPSAAGARTVTKPPLARRCSAGPALATAAAAAAARPSSRFRRNSAPAAAAAAAPVPAASGLSSSKTPAGTAAIHSIEVTAAAPVAGAPLDAPDEENQQALLDFGCDDDDPDGWFQ